VPAGTFDCYLVKGFIQGPTTTGAIAETNIRRWEAPDQVRRTIAWETVLKMIPLRKPGPGAVGRRLQGGPDRPPNERILESRRVELVSFKQG